MLQNIKQRKAKQQGFTIIEVLIVLAIAGLIMLVVFLAVPALNRSSRNTTYRSEASQLLSATTEWQSNNNGSIPTAANAATIVGLTKNKNITGISTVESYSGTSAPSLSSAVLRTGAKCSSTHTSTTTYETSQAGARALALIFAVEDKDGNVVPQCIEG